MSLVISEILGTDPFSGSRITINANFQSIKSEIELIESNLGVSVSSGNIDVSSATGGQIKGKVGAFNTLQLPATGTPTITMNSAGLLNAVNINISAAATLPTVNTNNFTASSLGSSVFNGNATFNSLVKMSDGLAYNKINLGAITTHTVINSDRVLLFSLTSSGSVALTPDPSLIDGHVITLVKTGTSTVTLNTTYIMGFASGSITFSTQSHKSCITLMWGVADNKWTIIGSSNVTIS